MLASRLASDYRVCHLPEVLEDPGFVLSRRSYHGGVAHDLLACLSEMIGLALVDF